jgi:putative hydroxymethylpyrimidine transporter CytX
MKRDDAGPFSLSFVWFGAAVSMAEIATGALLAGTSPGRAMAANLTGHAIGAALLFIAAFISWKRKKNAVAASDAAFGPAGPRLFGILNVIQLVGWTAVMIITGARSMDALASAALGFHAETLWRLVIGLTVLTAALSFSGRSGAIGLVSVAALACLCLALTIAVFLPGLLPGLKPSSNALAEPISLSQAIPPLTFGAALELAVIMPLSWLPLVGDYVNGAKSGLKSCLASALAYSLGSVWMYALGFFSARLRGDTDPVALLGGAWALPALAIVLLSTVTTAFLDVRSAGISLKTVFPEAGAAKGFFTKGGIIACGMLGLILALVAPVERYQSFLAFIGSVFAPLYAVIFADALLSRASTRLAPRSPLFMGISAFLSWAAGVALYFVISSRPGIFGASLPVMAAVAISYFALIIGGSAWKRFRASKTS